MLYLMLAVLCSSLVAVFLRVSHREGLNRLTVIAANYAVAVLLSLLLQGRELAGSLSVLNGVLSGGRGGPVPATAASNAVLWGFAVGVPMGVLFFLAFLVYRKALRESGLGLSGGFAKMGILLPMVLSMLFWREYPGLLQGAGILMALGAAALGAFRNARGRIAPVLFLVFLLNGSAEFGAKVYQVHAGAGGRDFFLFWVFTVALLCSLTGMVLSRVPFRPSALALGVPLGAVNYFSSWFLIPALDVLNTSVVFSVFGAGTVVLLSLAGRAFFRERLSRRETAVLGLAAVALVLVNL